MKRFLVFLCVPVLDGARVGVGNLKVRLRFEVEIYFPNFESARVGECTSHQWSLERVRRYEETGDWEERSVL